MPKKINPTKIEKENIIWTCAANGWSVPEIANEYDNLGITASVVRHTLKKLERYKTKKALTDYFKMGMRIADIFLDAAVDPDLYVGKIMSALYVQEVNTEAKLKKMTDDDFDEFLHCKQLRCAGWKVHAALITYREMLRGKSVANRVAYV